MKQTWTLERDLFLLAVQFLTRLPVPRDLPYSDDLSVRAVKYYPAVGLIVGGAGALVLWLAALVWPVPVAVCLSLAVTLLITGGLHEDGLADCADGLGGGATAERAMEIMRDSRIGSYAALALIAALACKITTLSGLTAAQAALALIGGQTIGRMAAVHVIATTRYARPKGNKFAAPQVTPDGYRWAAATTIALLILLVLALGPAPVALAGMGAIALGQTMRRLLLRRLDGYTGDGLGAIVILSELGFYLGLLAWL